MKTLTEPIAGDYTDEEIFWHPILGLPPKPYFWAHELAAYLGCTSSNIRKMVARGTLKGLRTGHRVVCIERQSVIDYLRRLNPDGVMEREELE